MRILAIAGNTFREALRDKVLLTLVVVALIVTAASRIVPPLAVGEGDKIIKDLGLATMTLFCVLIAILVGGRLVYREIEKRTILTILAHPVRRWEFLLGKYLGLMTVLAVSVAILSIWFGLLMVVSRVPLDIRLLLPIGLLLLELGVITAAAILFSTFVTPISSAVFTLAVYVAGNMSQDLLNLAALNRSPVVKTVAYGAYYLLPNFRNLDVRLLVIHDQVIAPERVLLGSVHAVVYVAAALLVALLVFQRRDF